MSSRALNKMFHFHYARLAVLITERLKMGWIYRHWDSAYLKIYSALVLFKETSSEIQLECLNGRIDEARIHAKQSLLRNAHAPDSYRPIVQFQVSGLSGSQSWHEYTSFATFQTYTLAIPMICIVTLIEPQFERIGHFKVSYLVLNKYLDR